MKRIFIRLLILVCLSVFTGNKADAQASVSLEEIAEDYIYSTGYVGAVYTISGDGKYEYSIFSDCCNPVWREIGSIEVKNNLLHLRVNRKILNQYNLLDAKEATEAYRRLMISRKKLKRVILKPSMICSRLNGESAFI